MKWMNKNRYKLLFFNFAILIFLLLFFTSILNVIRNAYYEIKVRDVQKIILEQVIQMKTEEGLEKVKAIDFKKLKELNSDIIGWIFIPDTHINYAIVKGVDNSFYLNHDTLKEYNIYGSIFMNYENNSEFLDANTILFGHNTYKDSMFSDLLKIYEGEMGRDIIIYIYTEKEVYQYQVYSSYITTDVDAEPLNIYQSYFEKSDLFFSDSMDLSKTLTLSTCYRDDERRVILHAMKKK